MDILRPRALRAGDTIGIVAPSSPTFTPTSIEFGRRILEDKGFRVRLGATVHRKNAYLAGTDEERAEDLNAMFADPEVAGIVCLRGGYGAMRMLGGVDFELIRKNPKVFVGYSDITALHLAIWLHCRLVTFHGPMVASEMAGNFSSWTAGYFWRSLTEASPLGRIVNPPDGPRTFAITTGRAAGTLLGGNLSLVAATVGTPYGLGAGAATGGSLEGAILFLEDVGEEPYRVDRMLTQLRLAGLIQRAGGIVFGESVDCRPAEFRPGFPCTFSLEEVLFDRLGDLGIPVFYGLAAGHGSDKATLPLGVRASMDADKGTLTIEEAAVA